MATETTFTVSKRGEEGIEVSWSAPENLDDPRWAEVVQDPEKDINSAAVRNIIISIQSGARSRLEQGAEAVQAFVDAFKTGVRQPGGGRARPKLDAETSEALGFTEEQLAALSEAGMNVEALG